MSTPPIARNRPRVINRSALTTMLPESSSSNSSLETIDLNEPDVPVVNNPQILEPIQHAVWSTTNPENDNTSSDTIQDIDIIANPGNNGPNDGDIDVRVDYGSDENEDSEGDEYSEEEEIGGKKKRKSKKTKKTKNTGKSRKSRKNKKSKKSRK